MASDAEPRVGFDGGRVAGARPWPASQLDLLTCRPLTCSGGRGISLVAGRQTFSGFGTGVLNFQRAEKLGRTAIQPSTLGEDYVRCLPMAVQSSMATRTM